MQGENARRTDEPESMDALSRHLAQELSSIDAASIMEAAHEDDERTINMKLEIPWTSRSLTQYMRDMTFMAIRLAASPLREFASLPPWAVRSLFHSSIEYFTHRLLTTDEQVAAEMRHVSSLCAEADCEIEPDAMLRNITRGVACESSQLLASILAGRRGGREIRVSLPPLLEKNASDGGVFPCWTADRWMHVLLRRLRMDIGFSTPGAAQAAELGCWDGAGLPLRDWLVRETARFLPRSAPGNPYLFPCEPDWFLHRLNCVAALETSEGADIARAVGESRLAELVEWVRTQFVEPCGPTLEDLRALLRNRDDPVTVRTCDFGTFMADAYGFSIIESSANYMPSKSVYSLPGAGPATIADLLVHATERIVRFLDEPTLPSAAALLRGAAWFLCEESNNGWAPAESTAERLFAMRLETGVLSAAAYLAPRGTDGAAFLAGPAERFVHAPDLAARFAALGHDES